jgi:hypothetical protein
MSTRRPGARRRAAVLTFLAGAAALAAACGDGPSGPVEPPVSRVAVSGVSLDPAAFHSSGTFSMGIVPTGADGTVLLGGGVKISATVAPAASAAAAAGAPAVSAARAYTIALVSQAAQPAGAKPLAAALDIDNSGSMSGSDPQLLRRAASQAFWEAVLGARPANEVALADFGHGRTRGFAATRMLEPWGRDRERLRQRLDSMTASGGTPLYESALEMLQWIDTTRAASSHERVMVLMTDGAPNSDRYRDSVAVLARARSIKVHTVGLGDASDVDLRRSNQAAVERVRELAYRTGGVYAAASSAVALDTIFQTIARATSAGQFLAAFRISPVPPPGTVVRGTVTVTSGGVAREAFWSIVAP